MKENLNAGRLIRTHSGQYVDVFEPNPDTLLIEDIAHALSNQPRFGGHLPKFYSVAQHSVLCYEMATEEDKFDALMHDASEAYILDFPKPIKLEIPQYNEIEDKLMKVIANKFEFKYPKSPAVEVIDHYMLNWEWNRIMLKRRTSEFPKMIKCLTPKQAKIAFLDAFNKEIAKKKVLLALA
jgi:hypothetical protein